MSDEQYSITATADINWGNALNLLAISYDKGIELTASPLLFVELIETSIDKGFICNSEVNFDITVTPTKDVAITGIAEVFNRVGVFAKPSIDLSFTDLNAQFKGVDFSIKPSIDSALTGESDINLFKIVSEPTIDKTIGLGDSESQFYLSIDRLLRSLFTAPPDAEITVLRYMTSDFAETILDGCTIEAGVTNILQLQVLGSRLDTYLIEFFVRTRNDSIPVIYKSSSGNPGGIRLIGINNKASPSGTLQELIAQIILEPTDTEQFETTSVVNYECRMSHRGFGEDYRIAPKKDRGETGLFTITKY